MQLYIRPTTLYFIYYIIHYTMHDFAMGAGIIITSKKNLPQVKIEERVGDCCYGYILPYYIDLLEIIEQTSNF